MNRTERQKLGIKRWIEAGGHGILAYGTGVGKTYTSIMLIQSMYKRNPNLSVLVIVPTDVLKEQWQRELAKHQVFSICKVEIINTAIKHEYQVDLLILDEVHQYASEQNIEIFGCVRYKYVLGLTATLERLDGRHELLTPYLTVCDKISIADALENGWVSEYRNYKVLIDVDMSEYEDYNAKFQQYFAYFGHDFKLCMELLKSHKRKLIWAKKNNKDPKIVVGCIMQLMKYLKLRKQFVMSHPKKFEIVDKILSARSNKKIILFTPSVKDAELYKGRGYICHSQRKKAENKKMIEEFNSQNKGLICSITSLKTGVDIKGLSVGIAMTCNSSQILGIQSLGRVIRKEEGKVSEFFTLVIRNSIEENWFNNSSKNQSYITIDESQLDTILAGGEISTRPKEGPTDYINRY